MADIPYSQLPYFLAHQLVASVIARWNVLIKYTTFVFYSIKIRFVMAEIAYSQVPHFMGQLVSSYSYVASWNVLFEKTNFASNMKGLRQHFRGSQLEASFIATWNILIKQTNFAFYSIKIQLVMSDVANSQLPHQFMQYLFGMNSSSRLTLLFTASKSDLKWLRQLLASSSTLWGNSQRLALQLVGMYS